MKYNFADVYSFVYCYLFFPLVLRYQVERDGVERTGHDAENAAEDERGDDVGEEADQAGAQAEYEVAHKV